MLIIGENHCCDAELASDVLTGLPADGVTIRDPMPNGLNINKYSPARWTTLPSLFPAQADIHSSYEP